ncbi:MAG: hypothetical protein HY340_02165 [Candidatus Kerfeldbacteria bacterium]|nr:hypothetical protein [Candidatus Kerfeldbacteria bacterium]
MVGRIASIVVFMALATVAVYVAWPVIFLGMLIYGGPLVIGGGWRLVDAVICRIRN